MDIKSFNKVSETEWRIEPSGAMRVPAVIYAGEQLIREMDDKVKEQLVNVTMLPGIVRAAYAMPDAHWGFGFPIGGVAAFDAAEGGVISAGGVGFRVERFIPVFVRKVRISCLDSGQHTGGQPAVEPSQEIGVS